MSEHFLKSSLSDLYIHDLQKLLLGEDYAYVETPFDQIPNDSSSSTQHNPVAPPLAAKHSSAKSANSSLQDLKTSSFVKPRESRGYERVEKSVDELLNELAGAIEEGEVKRGEKAFCGDVNVGLAVDKKSESEVDHAQLWKTAVGESMTHLLHRKNLDTLRAPGGPLSIIKTGSGLEARCASAKTRVNDANAKYQLCKTDLSTALSGVSEVSRLRGKEFDVRVESVREAFTGLMKCEAFLTEARRRADVDTILVARDAFVLLDATLKDEDQKAVKETLIRAKERAAELAPRERELTQRFTVLQTQCQAVLKKYQDFMKDLSPLAFPKSSIMLQALTQVAFLFDQPLEHQNTLRYYQEVSNLALSLHNSIKAMQREINDANFKESFECMSKETCSKDEEVLTALKEHCLELKIELARLDEEITDAVSKGQAALQNIQEGFFGVRVDSVRTTTIRDELLASKSRVDDLEQQRAKKEQEIKTVVFNISVHEADLSIKKQNAIMEAHPRWVTIMTALSETSQTLSSDTESLIREHWGYEDYLEKNFSKKRDARQTNAYNQRLSVLEKLINKRDDALQSVLTQTAQTQKRLDGVIEDDTRIFQKYLSLLSLDQDSKTHDLARAASSLKDALCSLLAESRAHQAFTEKILVLNMIKNSLAFK